MIASVFALAGTPAAGTNPASYLYAHTSSVFDVTYGPDGSCSPAYLCTGQAGLAERCGVGRLVLFDDDPWRTDEEIDRMVAEYGGAGVPVIAAFDGWCWTCNDDGSSGTAWNGRVGRILGGGGRGCPQVAGELVRPARRDDVALRGKSHRRLRQRLESVADAAAEAGAPRRDP